MVDARKTVAEEFCAVVFDKLFIRPRDWSDANAAAHIEATAEAVALALPRSRAEGLAVVQAAGQSLKAEAKTNAWPTTREVVHAVREARRRLGDTTGTNGAGWPHRNSEFVIDKATGWVRKLGTWPGWLSYPDQVADELMERGAFEEADLEAAGWRRRDEVTA